MFALDYLDREVSLATKANKAAANEAANEIAISKPGATKLTAVTGGESNDLVNVRRKRRSNIKKRAEQLAQSALDCLDSILNDYSIKAADRIAAAKLTFDIIKQQSAKSAEADEDCGILRVVFDGMADDYAG